VGVLIAMCLALGARAGDPIDDLVKGVRDAAAFEPTEGTRLTLDSVVSGAHWKEPPERRTLDSDTAQLDAPQPVGVRGVLASGAWEFAFTPIWWISGPWTDSSSASASSDDPLLSQWSLDQWRIDGSVAWQVQPGVELRTNYSYSKDAASDADGQHMIDLTLSISF
jgi:hypothetical protein